MQFDLEIYKIDMFIVNMIQSIFFIDHNRHNNFVPCLFYLFTSKKKIVLLVVEGNIIRVGLFGMVKT